MGSQQDLYGEKHAAQMGQQVKKVDKKKQQQSKQWKSGETKVRPIFKTADQVAKEDIRRAAPTRIIDMTGPQARVLTSVADLIRDPEVLKI